MGTPPPYPLDDARSDRSHHHRVPHSPRGDDRLPSDRSHHQRNISMDGIESNPLFAGYLPPRSEVTHPSPRRLPNDTTPHVSDVCELRLVYAKLDTGTRAEPRYPLVYKQILQYRTPDSDAEPGERRAAQSGDPDRVTGYTPGYAASTSSIASTERSVRLSAPGQRPPTDTSRSHARKSRPPSAAASPAALSPGGSYLGSGCVHYPLPRSSTISPPSDTSTFLHVLCSDKRCRDGAGTWWRTRSATGITRRSR